MSFKKLVTVQRNEEGHWVGDGFPVRTLFDYNRFGQLLSPFLMMDYAGPLKFEPAKEARGVGEHPHRGFETVTVVYQGEVEHRDSGGNSGKITPGDVQWMTAASGVVHEEMHSREFTRTGGTLEMVQLWVNLPAQLKMSKPRYQGILNVDIPVVELEGGAGIARIIAGSMAGQIGAAQTYSPMDLWDLRLEAGKKVELTLREGSSAALFVLKGGVDLGEAGLVGDAELAVYEQKGEQISFVATRPTTVLLLSRKPLNEPIAGYGPFVMNTQQEIHQAMVDYQSGRMGHL